MVAIPTSIPTFADGDTSLANLEALANAVSFFSSCDIRPMWHFYKSATESLAAATWTTVSYNFVAADSDGVYVPSGGLLGAAQIVTQGYYVTEACAGILAGGAVAGFGTRFLATAGASNPNHTSGSNIAYGQTAGLAPDTANQDAQLCFGSLCPWVLYPGDTIQAQVFCTGAVSTSWASNTSYIKGRFAANFTGYWQRYGT